MGNKETKKLMERLIESYKIKKIILENVAELKLLALMKIYLVVNMSRIIMYQKQIEEQKKISLFLVEIEGEKKYEVEKIEQERYKSETKVFGHVEEIYSRRRYLKNLGNTIKLIEK